MQLLFVYCAPEIETEQVLLAYAPKQAKHNFPNHSKLVEIYTLSKYFWKIDKNTVDMLVKST